MNFLTQGMRIEKIYSALPDNDTVFFEIDTDSAGYKFSTALYFVTDSGIFVLTPELQCSASELPENLPEVSVMFPDLAGSEVQSIVLSDDALHIAAKSGTVRFVR